MSEQGPGPTGGDGGPTRRAAPAGYGTTRGSGERPTVPPSSIAAEDGAQGAGHPVYGRVTRFGTPGPPASAPARPAPPPGAAAWPPPAPYGAWGSPPPGPWDAAAPAGPVGPAPGPWWPVAPPRPQWRRDQYASWKNRVASDLVDRAPAYVASVLVLLAYLPLYRGLLRGDLTATPSWPLLVAGLLLSLASTGWTVYNRWALAGRTGQSVGKRLTRTWLVSADDGRPVGMLNAFLRDLLHVLDGLAYVGYLWPLWDEERQTLADKLIRTVVVTTPVPPLTDQERATRP